MRLPSLKLLVAAGSAAIIVAGCGSDGGSADGGADPASVMPEDAILYVEGVVQPEGDQKENVEALLAKVLRTDDPGKKVTDLIDEGLQEEAPGQTFEKDIRPWLGERVGVTATDLAADEPGYTVALEVTDADRAADFVAAQARDNGEREASYKDAAYFVDDEGAASGVVEDFVVVAGTEADFKSAVDTSEGDGLDDAERFEDAVDELPEERLGMLWMDTRGFGEAAAASAGDPAAAGVIENALKGVGAITAFAQAAEDAASIETRTTVSGDSALGRLGGGGAPELLQSLPGDSWAALGMGDLGESVRAGLESVAGGLGSAVLGGQLQEQLGIDLERDLLSWVGDAGVFVRGETVSDLGAGLVLTATDEDAAAAALPRIVKAISSRGVTFEDLQMADADQAWAAPVPAPSGTVVLARRGDRVVLALGDEAAQLALHPSGTLGDSGVYDRAREALDDMDPTFIVDAVRAVELIDKASAGDPDYAEAKPYLDMLDLLAAGTAKDGDLLRQRFTAKVR